MAKKQVEKVYCELHKRFHKLNNISCSEMSKLLKGEKIDVSKIKIRPKGVKGKVRKSSVEKEYCNHCQRLHRVGAPSFTKHLEKGWIKGRESEKIERPKGHKIKENKGYCVSCGKYHKKSSSLYIRHSNLGYIEGTSNFGTVPKKVWDWCVICDRKGIPLDEMATGAREPYCNKCYAVIQGYRKEGMKMRLFEEIEPEEASEPEKIEKVDKPKKSRKQKKKTKK